jgi:bacterial/archaeal transporter family protein
MPERWILFAIASMVFAGFTSVIAKLGLANISGELGLTIRTVFVAGFVFLFASMFVDRKEMQLLSWSNYWWLGLSGVTTTASWIFYYKAIKQGAVSTVALIDKGSFIVAVLLAWWILGEQPTWRTTLGGSFILIGLIITAWK